MVHPLIELSRTVTDSLSVNSHNAIESDLSEIMLAHDIEKKNDYHVRTIQYTCKCNMKGTYPVMTIQLQAIFRIMIYFVLLSK